jgi:hypothetical protein
LERLTSSYPSFLSLLFASAFTLLVIVYCFQSFVPVCSSRMPRNSETDILQILLQINLTEESLNMQAMQMIQTMKIRNRALSNIHSIDTILSQRKQCTKGFFMLKWL